MLTASKRIISAMAAHPRRDYLRHGALGALALSVGVTGCLTVPTDEATTDPPDDVPTATVAVGPNFDFVFEPGTEDPLTITAGTKVTFTWDSDGHNIIVGSQPADANWQGTPGDASDLYNAGYTYDHTFAVPGEYHYWCAPHKSVGMIADIVVQGNQ